MRLWVRFNGGSWADSRLADGSTTGFLTFVPTHGAGLYCFQSIARDVAGNTESGPSGEGDGCTNYATSAANTPPPLTPSLLSPPDGTVLSLSSDPVVYLSWTEAGGATSYNLQVDDNTSFDLPLLQEITIANNYTPSPPLDLGSYFRRVRGCNESGCGPWSAAWTFSKTALLSDNFSEALDIVGDAYSSMQDTAKATNQALDPVIPCVGHAGYHTVWYAFTAPADGTLSIDNVNSTHDTVIAIWAGDWGALQNVGCDDNGGGAQPTHSTSQAPRAPAPQPQMSCWLWWRPRHVKRAGGGPRPPALNQKEEKRFRNQHDP